ncbi:MAG: hypothetical protein SNH13_00085 [Rikenellaceae bacterium]
MTINNYSVYSMYGLGDLQTQGTLPTRSMGGAGVALRSGSSINLLNPASYSITLQKSVLFDFGMNVSCFSNSQGDSNSKYATANFHDIALQLPLYEGVGAAISVTPYSQTGYKITSYASYPALGYISYAYEGEGNITEVKFGVGWEIVENLSVGVAALYYWGQIDHSYGLSITSITSGGNYAYAIGKNTTQVSSIKWQLGVQWSPIAERKKNLTFGATFNPGGDLSPTITEIIYGNNEVQDFYAQDISYSSKLVLPVQFSLGVMHQTPKLTLLADYTFQDWSSSNDGEATMSITDIPVRFSGFSTINVGAEYIPNRGDIRSYLKRASYRAGLRYGGYYQNYGGEDLTQYAITMGVGFPTNMFGISKIDVGVEYNSLGKNKTITYNDNSIELIRQNQFKIGIGITMFGDDYWFQRPKYD